MRINGEWLSCEDQETRPVIRGEVLRANGSWRRLELLIDTGADRTVLSADVLLSSGLPTSVAEHGFRGIGG